MFSLQFHILSILRQQFQRWQWWGYVGKTKIYILSCRSVFVTCAQVGVMWRKYGHGQNVGKRCTKTSSPSFLPSLCSPPMTCIEKGWELTEGGKKLMTHRLVGSFLPSAAGINRKYFLPYRHTIWNLMALGSSWYLALSIVQKFIHRMS